MIFWISVVVEVKHVRFGVPESAFDWIHVDTTAPAEAELTVGA